MFCRLPRRVGAIVTLTTCAHRYLAMIECNWLPRACPVAVVTYDRRRNVARMFASSGDTIMASRTAPRADDVMFERCWQPGTSSVAGITGSVCGDVINRLTPSHCVVVADIARTGQYCAMIEAGRR